MFKLLISYSKVNTKIVGLEGAYPVDDETENSFTRATLERLNKYNIFEESTLENIPPGYKYVVYVPVYRRLRNLKGQSLFHFTKIFPCANPAYMHDKFVMPSRVWDDSAKNLVHWIIDFGTEAQSMSTVFSIEKVFTAFNTLPKNVTFVTGAETKGNLGLPAREDAKKHGYNIVTSIELQRFLNLTTSKDYVFHKLRDINNLTEYNYKALIYSRLPRPNRCTIVAYLKYKGIDSNTLYSLGTFLPDRRWIEDSHRKAFPELNHIYDQLEYGPEIYPHIKEEGADLNVNLAQVIGWNHGLNSYFQLVTETAPNNASYPFITEKSIKPFAMLQPFIQSGPMNNVAALKQYGYKVFEKWIDHSYDSEPNDILRLQKVLKEFYRLHQLSHTVWAAMLKDMTQDLLDNYHIANIDVTADISSQLIPILQQHHNL